MKKLFFSDHFGVSKEQLYNYGTIDISLTTDLPLFIDPFLLFNSDDEQYKKLHEQIINYLRFLRDKSLKNPYMSIGELRAWYCFSEVRQNWLGFTILGNSGSGLGLNFAKNLHKNLNKIFSSFGDELITSGSHLEKLCLVKSDIGKDNISDFTTNLIKDFLLSYTEEFARIYIDKKYLTKVKIRRAEFNYCTETWVDKTYNLPMFNDDYLILTPRNILTKDDTWINKSDLVGYFHEIPDAISNEQLRSQINNYFVSELMHNTSEDKPTKKEREAAVLSTIEKFPVIIDYYIKLKEDKGEQAAAVSIEKVEKIEGKVNEAQELINLLDSSTDFYKKPFNSLDEAISRVQYLKRCIEDGDGYNIINNKLSSYPCNEKIVQLLFNLVWYGTEFDFNREPNNGRGPVDGTVSYGSHDKSIIEFKLASNAKLKHGLEKQTEIYMKANNTNKKLVVIICYTENEQKRVNELLVGMGLHQSNNIIVIDARNDNKQSASKAI